MAGQGHPFPGGGSSQPAESLWEEGCPHLGPFSVVHSPLSPNLVESTGQSDHLRGGPADDRDAEHGRHFKAQHVVQLLVLLLRGGKERTQGKSRPPPERRSLSGLRTAAKRSRTES